MVNATFFYVTENLRYKINCAKLRRASARIGLVFIVQLLCSTSFIRANDAANSVNNSDKKTQEHPANTNDDAEKKEEGKEAKAVTDPNKENKKPDGKDQSPNTSKSTIAAEKRKFLFKGEELNEKELMNKIKQASATTNSAIDVHIKKFCETSISDPKFESKKQQLNDAKAELETINKEMQQILENRKSDADNTATKIPNK